MPTHPLHIDAHSARNLSDEQRDQLCDWIERETGFSRNDVYAITLGEGTADIEYYTDPKTVDADGWVVRLHARTHVRTLPPVWL
jgi:hypothetical protein